MKHLKRAITALLLNFLMATLLCAVAGAQGPAEASVVEPGGPSANPEPLPAAPEPQNPASATSSDNWRGAVSIYGWFAGMHGTVGAFGHDAGITSPSATSFISSKA
jgi:hypothetical protein